jgi:hypothetical protein
VDQDGKLSREEFARLLTAFAQASLVSTHELIDFMVVTSAVKDNSAIEKAYIKSVKDRTSDDDNIMKGHNAAKSQNSLYGIWKSIRNGGSNVNT